MGLGMLSHSIFIESLPLGHCRLRSGRTFAKLASFYRRFFIQSKQDPLALQLDGSYFSGTHSSTGTPPCGTRQYIRVENRVSLEIALGQRHALVDKQQ